MSRPRPRGKLGGLVGGRTCLGPDPGGGWGSGWGGGVSQHALRQTPQQQTATAADGTHPTGMHSCYHLLLSNFASGDVL